jgi:hypothetical protein
MELRTGMTPVKLGVRTCCCQLRWKGMYIDAEPDPSIPNTRDGMFWCSHTMTCLGPDGRVAAEGDCCEGRSCFERL